MKKKKRSLILPLVLVEIYWVISYILYRFGAVKWPFAQDNRTMIFVVLCDVFFCVGYVIALKRAEKKKEKEKKAYDISKLLWICIIISLLTAIPNSIRLTGNWYPQLLSTLANPGETYLKMAQVIGSNQFLNFLGFFDCFNFLVFPLLYFYWDKLRTGIKAAACATVIYYLMIFCSSGRNMPCMLFVMSVVVTYVALLCRDGIKDKKKWLRNTIICFLSIGLMFIMFQTNLSSRTLYSSDVETQLADADTHKGSNEKEPGSGKDESKKPGRDEPSKEPSSDEKGSEELEEEDIYNRYKDLVITLEQAENCKEVGEIFPMYTNPYTKAYVDPENSIYRSMPDSLKFIYAMGTQYVAGSYHTLGVALRMDFKWSYGIGFSEFLSDYLQRFTGINIRERTYGSRAVDLTDPPIISTYGWSTAYVQLAGDLTFPGVIVLFLLLGMLVARVWKDVIEEGNVLAVPFTIQIALFLLFVPLNCIVFGSGGYFVTFFVSAAIWVVPKLLERRKEWKTSH